MRDVTKSPEYWQGRMEEDARLTARNRARAALDAQPNFHELAHEVTRQLARDNARKQTILARSPHVANGMDAAELAGMSSRELAMRELKELGIDAGENDPEALLSAHHAGRAWARGMKGGEAAGSRLIGGAHDTIEGSGVDQFFANLSRHSAQDAASGGLESIIDAYINPKE